MATKRICDRCGKDFFETYKEWLCKDCMNELGWEYTPQTNADHIRSMTDEEMAKKNVRKIKTPVTGCYDYGESYTDYYDAWETSDGAIFWTEQPAVEYELHWLKQPYKEDTNV